MKPHELISENKESTPNYKSFYEIGTPNIELKGNVNDHSIFNSGSVLFNEIIPLQGPKIYRRSAPIYKSTYVIDISNQWEVSVSCNETLKYKSNKIDLLKINDSSKRYNIGQYNGVREHNELKSIKTDYNFNDKLQFDEILIKFGKENHEFWIHNQICNDINIQRSEFTARSLENLIPSRSDENVCNTCGCTRKVNKRKGFQSLENLEQINYNLHFCNGIQSSYSSKESVDSGIFIYEVDKQCNCHSNIHDNEDSFEETLEDEECYKWCTQLMVKKCIERFARLHSVQKDAKHLLLEMQEDLEDFSKMSIKNTSTLNKEFYRLDFSIDNSI